LIGSRPKVRLLDVKAKAEEPKLVQEEVRRLMELVRFLARTLGFNNSSLARRAQVPLASLVRYFKGEGEPKIEFLLALVRAMGLEVREFFELAYPEPEGPSAARLKVERILKQVQPGKLLEPPAPPPKPEPKPEVAPLQREDIEKMLDQLRKDVRELIEERETKTGASRRPRKENGES